MNTKILQEKGYLVLRVSGIHDSFTAVEICRAIISLLNDNVTKILIDTTSIMGYVPERFNKNLDLDCFPYELRDGSTRILFLETSKQIGNNLFGEIEYNKNGIPIMITDNKYEGLKWLL